MSGELRRDPVSGRWVVVAPRRAARPGAGRGLIDPPSQEELDSCPFCAGREDRTPPETLRLPDAANDWRVRVVPNLYPALSRQEVVVHAPSHARSLGELEDTQVDLVAEAWQRRRAGEPRGYLHALVNEGAAAGGSLQHSHSQLVWLDDAPPAVAAERDLSTLLDGEPVVERDGVVVVSPKVARLPYELVIAPATPERDAFTSDLLAPSLRLLADAIRRLHALEGPVPLNAWLHDGEHWHIELVPRLTVLAGLELGAGVYVNTVAPEDAATRLRGAG